MLLYVYMCVGREKEATTIIVWGRRARGQSAREKEEEKKEASRTILRRRYEDEGKERERDVRSRARVMYADCESCAIMSLSRVYVDPSQQHRRSHFHASFPLLLAIRRLRR